MAIRWAETIFGTRFAVCGSPVVAVSYFPGKRVELGAGIGAGIQVQTGGERSYDISAAPFFKLYNRNWVASRFSIGPVMKINYCAKNDFFTRTVTIDHAKVLPGGAWWFDFGLTYSFHF
jgi:hypothetical protein